MNPVRILVVDDASTVRLYHRKVLAEAGWHVEEAVNGAEALERLVAADDAFDLLVVDVNMPRMDGCAFVRALRHHATLPQPPVLMVSTEAQAHDAQAAREAGANAYLVKPAHPDVLRLTAALLVGDAAVARRAAAGVSAAPVRDAGVTA